MSDMYKLRNHTSRQRRGQETILERHHLSALSNTDLEIFKVISEP